MKKIYHFVTLVFLGFVSFAQETTPKLENRFLEETLTYLASDELEGRKTGTEGIEKAAVYMENIFTESKLQPFFTTYRDSFKVKGQTGYNLVALKEGNDPELKEEYIVLGAHYDHIGKVKKDVDGDFIANGANDNAAGTTAVVALAKQFAQIETKRSILFVLFSAEEEGLEGSKHLAKKLDEAETDIYVLLNFEMIGVPLKGESYQAYLTGYEKSNLAEKFNHYAGEKVLGFFPKAQEFQLFKRSDNYPFYKYLNIPAQSLSTFDFSNYDYYHHVKDESDLMDFAHMRKLIESMSRGIEKMANTPEKEIYLTPKK
ncbi:M20/M25/M40 family metallo-hydrolase [Haloflavibacter putidus]|uniref:M20/M25/M40 family metallo-hydrolase n=1 Tax=Haloflavibacter putidus TaxID=2576776 RepID=A0A507Z9G8_9FLAO|nr:M20/M25/M40 family metallo-hydrolase [Haloflavibacter putidus]TQD34356.1 M20/M25/M40 family metallo-hydrolase [Haloflavibacter putidus]